MNREEVRLKCWEMAITMAGVERFNFTVVDDLASRIYDFVASGDNSSSPAASGGTSDSTETPVRRGPGRPRKS